MTIARILIGLLIAFIGYLLVSKADWLLNNFGRIGWFEQHMGTEGGTRAFYKIVGILAILIGILYATGFLDGIVRWIFDPIFKGVS